MNLPAAPAITMAIGRGYWPQLLSHQVIDEQWPGLAVTTYFGYPADSAA